MHSADTDTPETALSYILPAERSGDPSAPTLLPDNHHRIHLGQPLRGEFHSVLLMPHTIRHLSEKNNCAYYSPSSHFPFRFEFYSTIAFRFCQHLFMPPAPGMPECLLSRHHLSGTSSKRSHIFLHTARLPSRIHSQKGRIHDKCHLYRVSASCPVSDL